MSDVSSVPLEAAAAPRLSSSSWKQRGAWFAGFVGAAVLALLSMCAKPALPGGLLLGALATSLSTGCLLTFLGTWRSVEVVRQVSARALVAPLGHLLASSLWLWLLLRLAVAGVLPLQTALLAVAVPAGFIWWSGAAATLVQRLGLLADPELPLLRRQGFWLIVLTALLHLPRLGSWGLIDPWETHYGEVAREMLSRDDWISLWWAQDGWFWSKPILNFWAQALSFSALGVQWAPDQMLAGLTAGHSPQPEWAARLPVFAMALIGQHFAYLGARAYVGRWAAFWGVFVLATTPYWYFLTRQSMADMAYVGPMCAAMGCLLLALRAAPEALVQSVAIGFGRGPRQRVARVSGYQLLFGAILLLALPQIIYLLSRNVSFEWAGAPLRLRLHVDQVTLGSPGNCGLPGNLGCRPDPTGMAEALQPAAMAAIWAACAGVLLWFRRRESREKQLWYLAAWLFTALSFMGKGAPGLVLVMATFVGFLVARGRASELSRADFFGFGLILACVGLPWFVQEYLRHGSEFFERLFIHDMYQRAFSHVHDTNKGDDTSFRYYVWQLGYGLFPWSGLIAAGALYSIARATLETRDGENPGGTGRLDFIYFCTLWLLAAFGMFAITGTKYHHYVLPLVPAAALLAGVWFRDALERAPSIARPSMVEGGVALCAAVFVGLAGRDLAMTRPGDVAGPSRLLQLFTYNYARSWPTTLHFSGVLWVFTLLGVLLCLGMLVRRLRRACLLAFAGLSVAFSAWAIDVYLVDISPHWGQRETIATYYQRRASPSEPLIAYQLNWKGENFYTGNNVPAFVSSGKRFTDWVEAQKKNGVSVMFFTTEHSRIGALQRELGTVRKFEVLTTPELNDKFALARAEL
jgi:4-amino-4-deoxy-L-arabinose transferase-like glycosyltransferase